MLTTVIERPGIYNTRRLVQVAVSNFLFCILFKRFNNTCYRVQRRNVLYELKFDNAGDDDIVDERLYT